MGHRIDEHTRVERGRPMMPPAHRARTLIGIVLLSSLAVLVGCGQAAGGSPVATSSPIPTPLPTVTPTETETATATSAPTNGPCQTDPYGFYTDQTGFVTSLNAAPLPAPPKTKHGLGSTGVEGGVSQGGESGMCTIGTFASVSAFYNQHLPALGWQYSAPPAALAVCFHNGVPTQAWWKGSTTFTWYDSGDAGAGSIFWSYSYCSVQS